MSVKGDEAEGEGGGEGEDEGGCLGGGDINYSTNTIPCTHLDIVHSSQYV